ncbi:hypothetical protein Fmac_025564 [Flemingia macrophylla]|uniref:Uncharacterized protein n=1 Tax=Flemingia macrophylla TaxID=520843 RepID=A0ABD1LSK8_9FABA
MGSRLSFFWCGWSQVKEMGKGPCVAFVLLVINLVFTIVSVGTMAFGLICFLGLKQNPSKSNTKSFIDHRMLLAIDSSEHFHDQIMPIDRNGNFQKARHFLNIHWNVIKGVALGVLITQVIAIVLAVYLQSVFKRPKLYGKRDEHEHVDYLPPFRSGIPNYRILEENKIKTNPSPRNST